ncbi:hypothetical protein HOE04_01830 [archaeon]|jgi:glucokinase|nr:hypothetical protein [archaeon]
MPTEKKVLERKEIPQATSRFYIAGDVSATNILIGVYSETNENLDCIFKANYNGQRTKDFNTEVLEDILRETKLKNINAMVLSPAGPINQDGSECIMTNSDFSVNAKTTKIPTALINDYKAIAYSIAEFKRGKMNLNVLELLHTNNKLEEAIPKAPIAIQGPGTGLGTTRLHYDRDKKLYFPFDSEGGHKFLPINPSDEKEIMISKYLSKKYKSDVPHLEAVLSGRGVEDIFNCLYTNRFLKSEETNPAEVAEYKKALTETIPTAYIAKKAKEVPGSIYGETMDFVWKSLGRAFHDLALHEGAKGGIYGTGGVLMKNIETKIGSGELDKRIARVIMNEFDNGPTQREWVNKVPVYAVIDNEIGLKGALACLTTPEYNQRERFYLGENLVNI